MSTANITEIGELDALIANRTTPYLEVWAKHGGRTLAALINADTGWLTLFRFDGDAGVSTVDPTCQSDADVPFRLNNGQIDHYPENFCVSLEALKGAIAHFLLTGEADPALTWTEAP